MAGEAIRFDPGELTIGDLEDFEEVAGVSFGEAFAQERTLDADGHPIPVRDADGQMVVEDGKPVYEGEVKVSAKAMKAIIWILKRRENPEFTLADARNVKVTALEIVSGDDAESPTAAAS